MYPGDTMATSSIAIPKMRRRYLASPLSSSPVPDNSFEPQELVKGYGHLCFAADGSWFEGHLITDDESQYGLSGNCPLVFSSAVFDESRRDSSRSSSSDEGGGQTDSPVGSEGGGTPFAAYDVTVNDHDDDETFSFTAEKSYRGQMADMLIQRYLTPRLVGKNLRVYAGRLTVDLNPPTRTLSDSYKGRGPLWCL